MPKQTKTCRICGAEYEACRTIRPDNKTFNWREVACSPECGTVYLQKIMASRSGKTVVAVSEPVEEVALKRTSKKKKTVKESADVSTDVSEETEAMHEVVEAVTEEAEENVDLAVEEE